GPRARVFCGFGAHRFDNGIGDAQFVHDVLSQTGPYSSHPQAPSLPRRGTRRPTPVLTKEAARLPIPLLAEDTAGGGERIQCQHTTETAQRYQASADPWQLVAGEHIHDAES